MKHTLLPALALAYALAELPAPTVHAQSARVLGTFTAGGIVTPNFKGVAGQSSIGRSADRDLQLGLLFVVARAPVNSVPLAQTTPEDTPLVFSGLNTPPNGLSVSDADAGPLTVSLSVTNGTLSLSRTTGLTFDFGANNTGSFRVSGSQADLNAALEGLRFVPDANFNSTANGNPTANRATLVITTSDGVLSDQDTVLITVSPVNDAPVARDDTASAPNGASTSVQVLANDTDVENDALIVSAVDTTDTRGTAVISADKKTVLFTPEAGFSGTTSFGYTASDGSLTSSARVTITVTAAPSANRAPVALGDAYDVPSAGTRTLQVLAPGVLANDSDPDGNALQTLLVDSPKSGRLILNPNGSFTYTPGALFSGSDTFTYSAFDGQFYSTPATVTLRVPATRDVTPPLVTLAGGPVRRLPQLPGARGSAVDVYALAGLGTVPSSGLRGVILRLQNGAGLFWNGRSFQSAPFDLRTRIIDRSFFALADALPPARPANSPDERFIYTAIATDGAGNSATTSQIIVTDNTPPGLVLTTPAAGVNNTVVVSRLSSIGGRSSGAVRVEVALRNAVGQYFDGTSFVSRTVFLSAPLSGVNFSRALAGSFPPGRYLVQARAFDEAGNPANTSRTVIVASSPTQ
jgi:hypothetical protein